MARQVGLYRGFRGLLALLDEVRGYFAGWECRRRGDGLPLRELEDALELARGLGLTEARERLEEIVVGARMGLEVCWGEIEAVFWALAREMASRLDNRPLMDFVVGERLGELFARGFCTLKGRPRYLGHMVHDGRVWHLYVLYDCDGNEWLALIPEDPYREPIVTNPFYARKCNVTV